MIGSVQGPALTGVPVAFLPTLGSNPNGLVINPFGGSPAAVPFIGTYHYPGCDMTPVMFELTAPLTYNNHHFIRWQTVRTDCYGNSMSMILTGSNVISYPLDNDYVCTALYDDCCNAVVTNSGANCCDGSIDFSPTCGNAPYTYLWASSATTQDITGLCPGTYCVTVTDVNGDMYVCCWDVLQNKSSCQSVALQNQSVPNGRDTCFEALQSIYVAGNGSTFTVQNGGNARLIAGEKILLMTGTRVISGGYMQASISQNGQYCSPAKLPDQGGPDGTISANQAMQPGKSFFSVYPNPTTGSFTLELRNTDAPAGVKVELYGMEGERIRSEELRGGLKYTLSLAGKPVGVYFIRVTSGNYTGTRKIILQ